MATRPTIPDVTPSDRPRRVDAERNRKLLLDTARRLLVQARPGEEVTMQQVARAADVGQGTLYRHFPSREALLIAVYRHDVEELVASTGSLLAKHPPLVAFRKWLERLTAYGKVKRGLTEALRAAARADLSEEYLPPVLEAIDTFLQAGRDAGVIRHDINASEVLNLCSFLWRDDDVRLRSDGRMLNVVFDGLRAAPGTR